MGRYSGVKDAKYTERGAYILPGEYLLRVKCCKDGETRPPKKEAYFLVEFDILRSSNSQRPANTEATWFVKLTTEPAMGNIKKFISVASGTDMGDVDEAGCEMVVSAENPLAGTIVRCSATEIETKSGNPFTLCKWYEASAEETAEFADAA